jgi:type I restriction enzyme S subunit
MKLVPYPEYKDSGVPWFGIIPEKWKCLRLRNAVDLLVSNVDKHTKENELPVRLCNYVDVYKRDYLTSSMQYMKATATKEEIERFRLHTDDVVITKDSENYLDIAVPAYVKDQSHNWICGYHLAILRPRQKIVTGKYLHWCIQGIAVSTQFSVSANGVTRYGLSHSDIKNVIIPVPKHDEQTQIARFLDWKTAQINKFIRNKRRLIELLKEQKQNIINQAVTRGLDPNVKLKPSGVEWIGDIPEHWEVTKLKRVVTFNPSKSETRANPADEKKVVFLPMENISVNGNIDCTEKRMLSEVWNGFTYFRRGDVVVAKITPCFENGKGAYLKGLESDFGFGTTELIVLRPSKAIDGAFLRFLTSTKQFLLLGEQYMTGAAGQQRIPSDFVKNYPIGLPPIDEQLEILEHIQEKSAEIDQAISRAQREIELMREYRTRLISDVVTGQVDVRGIEVPEVAEEELLALEEDTIDADDVIDDEGDMDETD